MPLRIPRGAIVALLIAVPAVAGRITGRVVQASKAPAPGVSVTLLDTGAVTLTSDDGTYTFEDIAPGTWTIEAASPRLGDGFAQAIVESAEHEARADIQLDLHRHHETVIVSASPDVRGREELYQAASVLEDVDLARRAASTLGEALAHQPGVHSTWFGPGASRPVIRGLGGERVRVMTNGVDVGDASSTSPDHAVSVSPFSADRIEVIRGPATLLHGSNAIGGAVNVLDNRVPSVIPETPVYGSVQLRGASASDELAGAIVLDGGAREVAWHLDGYCTSAGDLDTPPGVLANTQSVTDGLTGGASWVGARAFVGLAASRSGSTYGSAAEEEVTIDMSQRRLDLRGEARELTRTLRALRWRAASSDYEHVELEGDEVGTRFLNDTFEARVEGLHGRTGVFSGSAGAQFVERDFAAIGDESFVPPTTTRSLGLFVYEEIELEPWRLQLGARWDSRDVGCRGCAAGGRDFDGVSASVGVLRPWGEGWSFSAALTRSVRHPGAEELFAEGPHLATGTYERGNPELRSEVAHGIEVGLRHHGERWHLEASAFVNEFDGFIRESATGEIEDGLPVFEFAQSDARTHGAEIDVSVDLIHREPHHLRLELGGDFVEADHDAGPLPRTPPARAHLGLRYQGRVFWALVEATRHAAQDDVDALETRTPGHSMLEASCGWRIVAGKTVHDVVVAGTNLGDELARNHVSFLKDVAPLPGRGVTLTYRVLF